MKYLLNLNNGSRNFESFSPEKFEFVIECKFFSRFGKLDISETAELTQLAKSKGFDVYLQFDLLLTQDQLSKTFELLDESFLSSFKAIRLQDPGVAFEFKDRYPEFPVHLILETANRNLKSIKTWEDFFGKQLERIILSNELPKEVISDYRKQLDVELEILAAGRLLLFYTPRTLLSASFVDHDDSTTKEIFGQDYVEITGSSEESPHTGFPIVENSHGTFMFLPKDYLILDQIDELKDLRLDVLRVDLGHIENSETLEKMLNEDSAENMALFKKSYPKKTIKGFFNTNKSDVLFKKLKNKRTLRKDENFCGEVLEVHRGEYMALSIQADRELTLGDTITYYSPDGKIKTYTIKTMKNSLDQEIEKAQKNQIVYLPHMGGISVKTMVYLGQDPLALQ